MPNEKPRLSPTIEGYAAENSRITEGERQKELTELEKINLNRALDEKAVIGQGTFLIGRAGKSLLLCEILAAAATLAEISYILSILPFFPLIIISEQFVIFVIITAIYILFMTPIVDFIRGGAEYKYEANLREFSFSRKKGKGAVAHFFYKDILSVDYCPHKFLWYDNGYYVSIETKSGFFTYKYVFPRFKHWIPAERLPFEVIREQTAENPKLPEQQSARLAPSGKKIALMLGLAALCVLFGAIPIIMDAPLYYIVAMGEIALLGFITSVLQIFKGELYRYRADNREFIIRRADGVGKTVRIRLDEAQDIAYKKRLLGAVVVIKTKDKTLKFKYRFPKVTKRQSLSETPFGVFANLSGGQNER